MTVFCYTLPLLAFFVYIAVLFLSQLLYNVETSQGSDQKELHLAILAFQVCASCVQFQWVLSGACN